MAKFYFHLVYDDHSDLDQQGSEYRNQYAAAQDAELTLITLALEAQIHGKPAPRSVAILDNSIPRKLIATKAAD